MVYGGGCVLLPSYVAIAYEWPEEVRIVAARNIHIHADCARSLLGRISTRGIARNGSTGGSCTCSAVVRTNGLSGQIGIQALLVLLNLVQIPPSPQMCPLAANVRDDPNYVRRQFALDVEMKLLDVGPYLLLWNRDYALGELRAERAHLSVARGLDGIVRVEGCGDVALDGILHQGWRTLQRSGNGLVA